MHIGYEVQAHLEFDSVFTKWSPSLVAVVINTDLINNTRVLLLCLFSSLHYDILIRVLTFHHCYISIGSRITRWHPLTTVYPSTAARMPLFRVVSQSRRHMIGTGSA